MPRRIVAATVACLLLTAGCGADDGTSRSPTPTAAPPSTSAPTPTSAPTGPPAPTDASGLEQPAIWPAAGVVLSTPEAAAADFVARALGVPPTLGEFQQGDARSGEIEVFFAGEGANAVRTVRSRLLLRQLGPHDGWFVLAAVNENAAISSPESRSTVPAAPLTVDGIGRGFEAAVIIEAFIAGDETVLDRQITQGGAMETPEPFTVTLDLSGASPGDVVMLLVRGGVGHELDPGDFAASPVVIGD